MVSPAAGNARDIRSLTREVNAFGQSVGRTILPVLGLTAALSLFSGGWNDATAAGRAASSAMYGLQVSTYGLQDALARAFLPILEAIVPRISDAVDWFVQWNAEMNDIPIKAGAAVAGLLLMVPVLTRLIALYRTLRTVAVAAGVATGAAAAASGVGAGAGAAATIGGAAATGVAAGSAAAAGGLAAASGYTAFTGRTHPLEERYIRPVAEALGAQQLAGALEWLGVGQALRDLDRLLPGGNERQDRRERGSLLAPASAPTERGFSAPPAPSPQTVNVNINAPGVFDQNGLIRQLRELFDNGLVVP